jgi:hypothetical protein
MRSPPKKRKSAPRPGNGGRRPGAGRPAEFVPTKEMRALVKMHLALRAYSYADLCEILINPTTGEPISTDTFARCFKREIKIAKMDIDGIAMGGFVRQLRKGNMTAFTLHAKTQWGWSERKGRPVPFEHLLNMFQRDELMRVSTEILRMSRDEKHIHNCDRRMKRNEQKYPWPTTAARTVAT